MVNYDEYDRQIKQAIKQSEREAEARAQAKSSGRRGGGEEPATGRVDGAMLCSPPAMLPPLYMYDEADVIAVHITCLPSQRRHGSAATVPTTTPADVTTRAGLVVVDLIHL